MVSFARFLLFSIGSVAGIKLAVRDLAASSESAADFKHCKKSCAPITTLAGSCASEKCFCPTVLTQGQNCVSCLGSRNVTLAEEINETFQECISEKLPGELKSSDKCNVVCKPLFTKMAACKLSDTCICSALDDNTKCHKCLLKYDKSTATTKDVNALAASCALPYSTGHDFPHDCDYACLNVYLALDTCLDDDYECLCAAGTSTRRIKKKTVTHPAFTWGTAACQKCVVKLDKKLAKEIHGIQEVCSPTPVTVTSTLKSTSTHVSTSTSKITTTATAASKALYPRLIVPVQKSQPAKSFGTQYITTVSAEQDVVVVFDIPSGAKGSCELSFHLPGTGANPGSGTSAYTLTGSKVEAFELKSEIKESATYSSLPAVSSDLGAFSLKEGTTATLSKTVTCTPGSAVSIKLSSVGGTSLKWFEDFNAPAVGIVLNQS